MRTIQFLTALILASLLLASGVNCDWSWGNKKAETVEAEPKASLPADEQYTAPEIDSGRSLGVPDSVLPLEKHQSYSPPEELTGEEGRNARFLGIPDKLCKIGVKGMCDGRKGYPPAVPSHYGNSVASTYTNYGQAHAVPQGGYAAPVKTHAPKKSFKKVFDGLFKNKKSKGYGASSTFIAPTPGYNAPNSGYVAPKIGYNAPNPGYNAPNSGYNAPNPSYQAPSNTFHQPVYKVPSPSYKHPKPAPHYKPVQNQYINPSPLAPAPKPAYKQPSGHYHSPKPKDIVQPVYIPKIATHVVSQIQPSKVHHVHSHTHVYKNGPSHPTYPRDNDDHDDDSFLSSSIKTTGTQPLGNENIFTSQTGQNNAFHESFIPGDSIRVTNNFLSAQDKRHINNKNGFGREINQATGHQNFQTDINKLATSFGNNAFLGGFPVDCQCVPRQYCAPEDLVGRNDPNEISHLLDARNDGSEILSNATLPEDYFDYDYIRSSDNTTEEMTTESIESNTTTQAPSTSESTTFETEETTISENSTETLRRKRSTLEETKVNSTEGLEGRQLNGFAPGANGCGSGHVCCRRPVYVAAKRSSPVCGKGNPSIHGRVSSFEFEKGQSDFGEYPWQAAILRDEGSDSMFVCGATLISEQYLLTAAHCVNDLKVEALKVRLGEWDVNRDTEFYKHLEVRVGGVFVHPEFYKGNLYNDIAVIRLSQPVDIESQPHIAPICLPPAQQDFSNFRCHVTGWGKDAFGDSGKFQHILKELEIPVVNPQVCENALRSTRLGRDYKLHKGFICAGGEKGKDACKGDGGGPLVCSTTDKTFHLAGIVSWGIGCGEEGIPGVYVNIPYYVEWIKSVTGN